MATIRSIDVVIATGNSGTDGDAYLGICGREFNIDSEQDDFQKGAPPTTYTFGDGANINFRESNDPREPYPLQTENLDRFPVYIRFAPLNRSDNWDLDSVSVTVNPGPGEVRYQALVSTDHLLLGTTSGLYCYLLKS
jgi:hypothetical protein